MKKSRSIQPFHIWNVSFIIIVSRTKVYYNDLQNVTYMDMKVSLIITKLILNTDIKYYLMLLYIKLGMTMYKHNILKNNIKYIKNINFIKYFMCVQDY